MSTFFWPSKEDVLAVHDISIARFGGTGGIRDEGLLDSALARPFASFAGCDAFPSDVAKTCAMCHAIISNHPFVDGNKRTGAAVLGMVLYANSVDFAPAHRTLYSTIMDIAEGLITPEELTTWIEGERE